MKIEYDIKDINLANAGKKRIEWAFLEMPVLGLIRAKFKENQSVAGLRVSCCLHITTETANLLIALKEGGADVSACASNPLSTQDDVAAALVKYYDIPVYAINNEDRDQYYQHLHAVLGSKPHITVDDGADLISLICKHYPNLAKDVIGGAEETTTGVIRLRAMEKDGVLPYPIISVNDSDTKHLFDNRYGTGQSSLDGIIRATNILFAGKVLTVVGYGWCGKGVASRAKGLGSRVIVCEVNPVRALEAVMDGFSVVPVAEAVSISDIIITVTGNVSVIAKEHFLNFQSGCILANAGHFDVEIELDALRSMSKNIRNVRHLVDEYTLSNDKKIYVLASGRLVNLSCAEGHPASVMDMSFANQALTVEYLKKQYEKNSKKMENKVYTLPESIDKSIASIKLSSMGIAIDHLSDKQSMYLSGWQDGT